MILLDTQALVWLVNSPEKLSSKAKKALEWEIKQKKQILVSSITFWEIGNLVKKGKLQLSMDIQIWTEEIEKTDFLQFAPIDNQIASRSVTLPDLKHKDPADRFIIATAREYNATIITSDRQIRKYPHVQTLW